MFLQVSVCPRGGWYLSMPCRWYPSMHCSRSPGGCAIPACIAGGIPACLATGLGGGGPGPGGCLLPGGAWSGGVPGPGGLVSQHALRQTPPPGEMATAADGTHPTGMRSCLEEKYPGSTIPKSLPLLNANGCINVTTMHAARGGFN